MAKNNNYLEGKIVFFLGAISSQKWKHFLSFRNSLEEAFFTVGLLCTLALTKKVSF